MTIWRQFIKFHLNYAPRKLYNGDTANKINDNIGFGIYILLGTGKVFKSRPQKHTYVAFHCYDCGFISAKTNDPDFGIEIDVVC